MSVDLGTVQKLRSFSTMGGGGPILAVNCAYVVSEGGQRLRKGGWWVPERRKINYVVVEPSLSGQTFYNL